MTTRNALTTTLLSTAVAAALLSGCNRDDNRTAGQKVDSAIATAEMKTDRAVDAVANKVESAANTVANKVEDASITASVNAELAKDPTLSALRIDVDTTGGRVVLRGTAPDIAARERATRLASSVKGVSAVTNELQVRG